MNRLLPLEALQTRLDLLTIYVERCDLMDGVFFAKAAAFISAGLAMGIGSIGPSIGQGMAGAKACENIGKYPESASKIRTTMMMAMGIIESSAIYCLLIAGGLLFISVVYL